MIGEDDPTEPYQQIVVELEVDFDANDFDDYDDDDDGDWAALVLRANSAPPLRPRAAEGPDALMRPPILLMISAAPRPGDEEPKLNEGVERALRRMGENHRRRTG